MTSAEWRILWDEWPRRFAADDHLRQVAKTVDGVVIGAGQVQLIVDDIAGRLELGAADTLLDLCCGNGVITSRLATVCRQVVGVDFSAPLLAVARRDYAPANVSYVHGSVLELDRMALPPGAFTKVLVYDALQHFTPAELRRVLAATVPLMPSGRRRLLLGGAPYQPYRRRWLDTPAKVLGYWHRRLAGRDLLGTWWRDEDVAGACAAVGLQCARRDQAPHLYNAAFRVDFTAW
jgi:SAM-dependent methyltransferase